MKTQKEFIAALAATKTAFKWTVSTHGDIRGKRKGAKKESRAACLCPIQAVHYANTKKAIDYDEAATALRIPGTLKRHIINAADEETFYCERPALRKAMLKVLDLTERPANTEEV